MIEFAEGRIVENSIQAFAEKVTEAKEAFIFNQFEQKGYSKQDVLSLAYDGRLTCIETTSDICSVKEYRIDNQLLFRIIDICNLAEGTIEMRAEVIQ